MPDMNKMASWLVDTKPLNQAVTGIGFALLVAAVIYLVIGLWPKGVENIPVEASHTVETETLLTLEEISQQIEILIEIAHAKR